ncbi:MAG: purine-binding chemotaxis protein CheW [bacterium]|nr:purine-binding chemotaxis protein CheW [bacterium]
MSVETVLADDEVLKLKGGKFLTFFLGEEEYALEIMKVQEIIGLMPITLVPQTPDSVLGIINLRGKVIPVLDLRRKFDLPAVDHDELTCIVVMQVSDVLVGILVDRVNEVSDLDDSHLQEMPVINAGSMSDFMLGVGKIDDRVLMLLAIERVIDQEAMAQMTSSAIEDMETADTESSVQDADEISQL